MKYDYDLYNRLEFGISRSDEHFEHFGRDILCLIQKYRGYLIGYNAELTGVREPHVDGVPVGFIGIMDVPKGLLAYRPNLSEGEICVDFEADRARRCIEDIFEIS